MSPASAAPAPQRVRGIHASATELAALAGAGERLALAERQRGRAPRNGRLSSRLRGRGMEFAESRIYTPGDDVRNMDWRVTARTGTAHTKVYEEERERPVMLVVDFGASMFFGSRVALKSVLAAEVATLLAWAAVTRGDRTGVLTFGIAGVHETRPAGGRRGALACIRALVRDGTPPPTQRAPPPGPDLGTALQQARRVCRPGTLVYLIGDFARLGDDARRHLGGLRRHCEVLAIRLFDRIEQAPPRGALLPISDGVNRLLLDTTATRTRVAWRQHFAAQRADCVELLRSQAVPLVEIATDDDVCQTLRTNLGGGTRRVRAAGGEQAPADTHG